MAPIGKHRQSLGVPRHTAPSETAPNGEKPPTTLKLWIIRIQSGGVVVEGYKAVSDNDATTLQNWRSTPIAARIDAKTLKTHSGSIYKLKAGIDEDEAAEAGIPEELIEAFASGFPENWKELVDEQLSVMEARRRRQSLNVTSAMNKTIEKRKKEKEEDNKWKGGKGPVLQFDETIEIEGTNEDEEERLKEAKRRRSLQKGRKSMLPRVQPVTPIAEEDEEMEKIPARKTPGRRMNETATPGGCDVEKRTPNGRQKGTTKMTPKRREEEEDEEMEEEEQEPTRPSASRASTAASTSRGGNEDEKRKKTPKGRENKEEEEEVYATPDETPRTKKSKRESVKNTVTTVAIHGEMRGKEEEKRENRHRRTSAEAIPREIYEKSIPLTKWVIRFVRGGTPTSIFPHFQFKCCGFRPECSENEWSTSCIQKVVPPYIMFTSSSIYRLDGPLDVNMAREMGFSPQFSTDFLMGFPSDWEDRLETFFNKTFGPPPQPKIVELMSDGGHADEGKPPPAKRRMETPKNSDGQKIRAPGLRFEYAEEEEEEVKEERKKEDKKSTSPSSSSIEDESETDEEAELRREARKVEREMRREERREAELRAKAKEEKKKKFEVNIKRTPDGVAVSRSGRTLRTPLASWAGEKITYDVQGNVVGVTGVTTVTKMTVGKTDASQTDLLAAHYGFDSPNTISAQQKERSIAPPTAERPKPAGPRKSKAANTGYSDEETERIYFNQYADMLRAQAEATPAFNMRAKKRRYRTVESSDSEAEAEERRKEEKRKRREERRRLKESEEEGESSDGGWRRKKKKSKNTKKVTVKKEKVQSKKSTTSKRTKNKEKSESEESEEESEEEIDHDEDAVTFVPSDEGSNVGQGGYSDDELIQSGDEEKTSKKKTKKIEKKKETVKRARMWKKEELIRLKLAIQAADPTATADGWDTVARSLGGDRTGEECKKIARERLKMNFDEPVMDETDEDEQCSDDGWSGAASGAASEDEERKDRRKARLDEDNRMKGVTAKKGTIAYAVEVENKKRELLMGGRLSQDDFFKDDEELQGDNALPSVAVFDPDDSLLECLDDEGVNVTEAPKQRTTKTARMAAAPATPRLAELSSYEDSPGGSTSRSTRRSSAKFIPSPIINQNDLTRYVHQLSRSKNMSMMSRSMADRSRMMLPPPLPAARGGRNVARAAEAIEKVEQSLRSRRRGELDDLDEDEENDDNVLPPGF